MQSHGGVHGCKGTGVTLEGEPVPTSDFPFAKDTKHCFKMPILPSQGIPAGDGGSSKDMPPRDITFAPAGAACLPL